MGYSGHSPLRRSRSFFKERRPRVAQKIKKLVHAGERAFLSRFFLLTSFSKAHFEYFPRILMNLSTFSKHFFSFRTRHLSWIDHSTETTSLTGLKKKKKKTTNIIIIIIR